MRISTSLFGLFGAVAGLAAGGAAYQTVAAPVASDAGPPQPVSAVTTPLPEGPQVRVVTAPCEKPARLEHGICVTHVWRTQVVYDPPVLTVLPSTPTSGGSVSTGSSGSGAKPAGQNDDAYDADGGGDDQGSDDHADDDSEGNHHEHGDGDEDEDEDD